MEFVLNLCNQLTVNIFEIYLILRLLDFIFDHNRADSRIRKLLISTAFIIALLVNYFSPYVWMNFLVSLFCVFLLCSCYKAGLKPKLLTALAVNLLLAASEIIVAVSLGNIKLGFLERGENGQSLAFFLSLIIFWLFMTTIKFVKRADKGINLPPKIWLFQVIVLLITFSELFIVCSLNQDNLIFESLLLLGAELTIYMLNYLSDCNEKVITAQIQNELILRERAYYKRELALLQDNSELSRQFHHDLKNRMEVIRILADTGNLEELKKYLSSVEAKVSDMQLYSTTGNLSIDAVINNKLTQASLKNIEVTASIALPSSLEINEDDIVVILGNLLDNALEANEYVDFQKMINLSFHYENGCLLLKLKNSYNQGIVIKDGNYISRKENKALHGIGLKSVKHTVEKYHGIMEIATTQDIFCVTIMLYI